MSRMRKKKNLASRLERASNHLIHFPEAMKGNWKNLKDPCYEMVFIELGCGKGSFICDLAMKYSSDNILFVGLDRVEEALVVGMEKALSMSLQNVFFVNYDIQAIESIFSSEEVNNIYINFCDPWPSKRHAKRRLTHPGFLKAYKNIMSTGGNIEFKTDNIDLFKYSMFEFLENEFKLLNSSYNLPPNITVSTDYEVRFRLAGNSIYYAHFSPHNPSC